MIAIVIPYYKLTFFEKTLQSLANQTDKRFNVYIGNDASNEDPEELLLKFKSEINFIYYKFKDNLGGISLTKQWERCINLSSNEEWIMILGDDDYMSENCIEEFYKQLDEINNSHVNVVRFAFQVYTSTELSKVFKYPKIESSTDSFYRKFIKSSRGSLSEQLFKRTAYLKHGFRDFPLAWGSDNFAWLDFTDFGNIYTINEAISYIGFSSDNISRSGYGEELKIEARFQYFKLIIIKYLNKFKREQHLDLLIYYESFIYCSNKISFEFWLTMSIIYVKKIEILQLLKFQRRVLKNIYKKWN